MKKPRWKSKSWEEHYADMPVNKRVRMNEKAIWAVNKLSDLDGISPKGSKDWLRSRLEQLVKDTHYLGFTAASKRFRTAVSARARNARVTP